MCAAGSILAAATNDLGLCEPVDPSPRRFHTRDVRVVGADRFTAALTAAIADSEVRAVLAATKGELPGTIDQAVDSTDVLSHPDRCRAAATVLGLKPI